MYKIYKISSFGAVDYAAEELRKYLRMMMPECGNIDIEYNPCAKDGFRLGLMLPKLISANEILKEGRELISAHYNSDYRVRTVSVRLLEFHARYIELFVDALIEKAKGNDEMADKLYVKFRDEVGKYELAFERWYDHGLVFYALDRIFQPRTNVLDDVIY